MRKEKIKQKLKDVEKGCKVRKLELDKRIKKAKEFVEDVCKITKLNYEDFKYVYQKGEKHAGWAYNATKCTFNFHKTTLNTLKDAEFERAKFSFVREELVLINEDVEFTDLEEYLIKKVLREKGYTVNTALNKIKIKHNK